MNPDLLLLFNRPFWLDEWHTMLVANRPRVTQVIGDLHSGADFAPPFVHVSLWTLRLLTGGGELEPWIARAFALACMVAGIAFTHAALRRRFDRWASLAGSFAVATHPLVVGYAFEARFYAPWLMFAAMFAWSLGLAGERRRLVAGCIAAAGLCTTHWFGVVTLGLMCAGAFLSRPERGTGHQEPGAPVPADQGLALPARIERIAPAVSGIAALLVCLPLLLGQRGSVRERSWIPELSWGQFVHLADTYWVALVPLLAIGAIAVGFAVQRTRVPARENALHLARDPSLVAMLTLAAMPVALVVLSLLQPVMLDRYAITSLLAWAPLVAAAAAILPRAGRYVVFGLFSVALLARFGAQAGIERQVNEEVARDERLLREHCGQHPVVFMTRLHMYYHTAFIRDSCPAIRYVALPNDKLARLYHGPNEHVQRLFRSENEFAELHGSLYGYPRMIAAAALDSLAHFVVMVHPSLVPRDGSGRELLSTVLFPRHQAAPLNGYGFLFERRP